MNPWLAYILGLLTPAIGVGVLWVIASIRDWAHFHVIPTWLDRGKWFVWIRWWKPTLVIKPPGSKHFVKLGWTDWRPISIQLGQKDPEAR